MIIIPPIPFIPKKKRRIDTPPPPAALILTSASYLTGRERSIRLGFDRAIDVAGMVGSAIVVSDADAGLRYAATGAVTMIDPSTVLIDLVEFGIATGSGITLTASDASGIVAIDDGEEWAGVMDLVLPYP